MDRLKDLWLIFLSLRRWKKVVVALSAYMLIAVVSGVVGNLAKPSGPSQPMTTYSDAKLDPYKDRPELDSTPWHDADLVEWFEDSNLAYTSFEVSSAQCGYGGCLGIIVQTQSGCSSTMYAEIELLDGSDINVGYSNDLIGRVSAGKKAKLIFNLSESEIMAAKNWNVTKISCY